MSSGSITLISSKRTPADKYLVYIEYDINNNPVYIGKAQPGSISSSSVWQIQKLSYDASGNVTKIEWAEGSDDFNKIWDNRANYNYS